MAQSLSTILEKIVSKDKDFRYMATSDLQGELQKPTFSTDGETEKKLCKVILAQLSDKSGDISALAVKCLGLLVHKVSESRVDEVLGELCNSLVGSGKEEQQRDVASIGLKTVIGEINDHELGNTVVKKVTPKMIEGMNNKDSLATTNECLDILFEVLTKFGSLMAKDHAQLKQTILPKLDDTRGGVRKRAIHCLAALSVYLSDSHLNEVCNHVLTTLEDQKAKPVTVRTYVQTLGAVSRAAGFRFGKQLGRAVPLCIKFCRGAGEDDELREQTLQALESFVLKSPQDAKQHLQGMLDVVLEYLSYDPNFADDMDADEDQEEDPDEEELSDGDYSDDDDVSWKVRRAATKCLAAIVLNYPDLLQDLYARTATVLVSRFREREESVKMDVFATFIGLVHQIGQVASRSDPETAAALRGMLQADTDAILRGTARQLREKLLKTRVGAFGVLKELASVLPDSVAASFGQLVPGIVAALNDKSSSASSLKIQALLFLKLAFASAPPQLLQPHVPPLARPLFAAVGERYYKVTAEALHVCQELVRVLRPDTSQPVPQQLQGVVPELYRAAVGRLTAQDQDQEVKEGAIAATAATIAALGDLLQAEVPTVLQALLDRLRNEISRLTAVKGLTVIVRSPLRPDLTPVLAPALAELTSFLRKANRALRQASLSAIEALVAVQGGAIPSASLRAVAEETAGLVSDGDLQLTVLALRLAGALLASAPGCAGVVNEKLLPQAMTLVKSPLLQGAALDALQAFYVALLQAGDPTANFNTLLDALLSAGHAPDTSRSAQHSIARCIAVVCQAAGERRVSSTVTALLDTLGAGSGAVGEGALRLALLCLAELGRRTDLAGFAELQPAVSAALQSGSEEIKAAASLALGGVAVGNLGTYLPFILQQIAGSGEAPKEQYLLLTALNEVLVSLATPGSPQLGEAHQEQVLSLLLSEWPGEEECRHEAAECAGHLALLAPARVLPALQQHAASPSPHCRVVAVLAVRHALQEQAAGVAVEPQLAAAVLNGLQLIQDADRHVRKAAVQLLSTAAHVSAPLAAPQLPAVLPMLYAQTVVNPDLIRVVDLGPFKHQIDDGLELRKAAFEAMDVLLEACPGAIDYAPFITHLQSGLKDHYDVKLPCHLLLAKLAGVAAGPVLAALEGLVEPMERTLTARLKSDAVKQEIDRNEDMLRSCLRAIEAISRIPNADACAPFKSFLEGTVKKGEMAKRYAAIKEERAEAEGAEAMDLS